MADSAASNNAVEGLHGPLAETPDGDIHDYSDHPDYPSSSSAGQPEQARRSAHYVEDVREDGMGFFTADCACGWKCPPCPDEETRVDFLMQHAYEAGIAVEAPYLRGRFDL